MDLRAYYRKVREVESSLPQAFVILVSRETPDGGKAGVMSEVSRLSAAKQVAEGRASVATEEEATAFHQNNLNAKRVADEAAALNRMQVVVMPVRPTAKGSKD